MARFGEKYKLKLHSAAYKIKCNGFPEFDKAFNATCQVLQGLFSSMLSVPEEI
jgi:hypothetical protein